jgi:hypothetical protein
VRDKVNTEIERETYTYISKPQESESENEGVSEIDAGINWINNSE